MKKNIAEPPLSFSIMRKAVDDDTAGIIEQAVVAEPGGGNSGGTCTNGRSGGISSQHAGAGATAVGQSAGRSSCGGKGGSGCTGIQDLVDDCDDGDGDDSAVAGANKDRAVDEDAPGDAAFTIEAIGDFKKVLGKLEQILERDEEAEKDSGDEDLSSFRDLDAETHDQCVDWRKFGELSDYNKDDPVMESVTLEGLEVGKRSSANYLWNQ